MTRYLVIFEAEVVLDIEDDDADIGQEVQDLIGHTGATVNEVIDAIERDS